MEDSSGYPQDEGISEQLWQIASLAREKRRLTPQEMQEIILALCTGRYLTAERVGSLVDRNPEHMRNRYLTPLVEQGLLTLTISVDMPTPLNSRG